MSSSGARRRGCLRRDPRGPIAYFGAKMLLAYVTVGGNGRAECDRAQIASREFNSAWRRRGWFAISQKSRKLV